MLTNLNYHSAVPQAPTLRFSDEGKYTILQVADLHLSVGPGTCRDLDPERERSCKKVGADQFTLEWLKASIAESKPDLVVFSGDQCVAPRPLPPPSDLRIAD